MGLTKDLQFATHEIDQDLGTDATTTFSGVNATTFDTNVAAAGVTLSGTTLSMIQYVS